MVEVELNPSEPIIGSKSVFSPLGVKGLQILVFFVDCHLSCETVPFDFDIVSLICI